MLQFVNAKINLGLQIVARRADGYHDLQTVFYPVGLYAGTALNPTQFCDVLEITAVGTTSRAGEVEFIQTGNPMECAPEKNLVVHAAKLFLDTFKPGISVKIRLDKHIPDGAGIGGGSADASFTLKMLNELCGVNADDAELAELAQKLGADCPFFILNRPAFASGVGEMLSLMEGLNPLEGKWLLLVKPDVYISTKEAFADVTPRKSEFDLRSLFKLPLADWKDYVHNDFEDSIFPGHPEFDDIKAALYASGARYASLTGSGSCLYGIFDDRESAVSSQSLVSLSPTIKASYLLKL